MKGRSLRRVRISFSWIIGKICSSPKVSIKCRVITKISGIESIFENPKNPSFISCMIQELLIGIITLRTNPLAYCIKAVIPSCVFQLKDLSDLKKRVLELHGIKKLRVMLNKVRNWNFMA